MKFKFDESVEDICAALAARRPVRAHGPYGILIGDEKLDFSPTVLADPVPKGAQILAAAGIVQPVEHLLFQMLSDGQLEEIRPEETTDLRSAQVEKFLVFRSDRSFRIQLNDRAVDWGAARISGATLKRLASVELRNHEVWLNMPGGTNRQIGDVELVDLSMPGVERFTTRPIEITIIVNARPKRLHQRQVSYWEVVRLAFPDAAPSENIIYSIDFGRGPAANPEGSLVEGQTVEIKEGMAFYVTPTDKS